MACEGDRFGLRVGANDRLRAEHVEGVTQKPLRAARSGPSGIACGEEWFCPRGEAQLQRPLESVELRPAARQPIFFGYIACEKCKLQPY
jgi:hypothetical protein